MTGDRDRAAVDALLKRSSEDLIQRYQTLFENSGTAMAVVEHDGTISLANTVFLNLLGYRCDDVENRKNIFTFSMSTSGFQKLDYLRPDWPGIPRSLPRTRHRS